MADKAIGSLVEATVINDADRFVLEQSGQAKQISGATMISELAEALDGHGGIQSIDLVGSEGNVKTYRITFTDGTTYDYEVHDGESGNYAVVAGNLAPYSDASGATQSIPFLSQGTGRGNGSANVPAGNYCQLKKKLGNTVGVNQQLYPLNSTAWRANNSTASFTDGVASFTATARYGGIIPSVNQYRPSIVNGHKYLFIGSIQKTTATAEVGFSVNVGSASYLNTTDGTGWQTLAAIYTASTTGLGQITCQDNTVSDWTENKTKDIHLIDLATWYGSNDRIPSDLLSHPENWGRYYAGSLAYNAGTLESADGTILTSIHRNIWDDEIRNGYYAANNNGAFVANANMIANANPIQVIPNEQYYIYSATYQLVLNYYDSEMNLIEQTSALRNIAITTPPNCRYLNFSNSWNGGGTYNHDITISLYYSGEPGYNQYYPFSVLASVDTGGEVLRSAGAVADEKTPDGTITRRVGVVDLGSLTWTRSNNGGAWQNYLFFANIADAKTAFDYRQAKYNPAPYNNPAGLVDKQIAVSPNGNYIYICDLSYTDTPTFKTAMSGVYLYYELATPATEQGTAFAENIPCNPVGSMSWENTKGIPQGAEILYPFDYSGELDDMFRWTNGDFDTLINIYGGTLRQVLAVKGGIDFANTAYVDLSSATWSNYSTNIYSASVVADAKTPASDWSAAAAISTKYPVTSRNGLTEGTFAIKQGSVLFYSTTVGSAANVRSVMKGVLLAYEKA